MPLITRAALVAITGVAVGACTCATTRSGTPAGPDTPFPAAALERIDAAGLLGHIEVLGSDAFEGRLPGTAGEQKTIEYLTTRFRELGLEPGNPDGRYVQDVPLVGITGQAGMTLASGQHRFDMQVGTDFVATTARFVPTVSVDHSQLVFVGYGVQAPEYDWDDYKTAGGGDWSGKTLVMLINDPAVPDPDRPGALDPALFRGEAMTYYGRWTYKYEIASRLGADAAIIIHETGPAGYPWSVVEHSWTGEQFELAAADRNMSRVPVQSWITLDKARELFAAEGLDLDALKQAATRRDFKPVPLQARASFRIDNQVREVQSHNVVARLPGTDPLLAGESVVYSAHWDHLGRNPGIDGDTIFNGALDNASGTAALLELAEAFATAPVRPRRSLLFMAVTAEEQGLLGARHYARHPLYPLDKTVAMINIDVVNPWGPTEDLQVIGIGQNTLEDTLASVLAEDGRRIVPDRSPEKGFYYRSDQFEFAKVGVPALYADEGSTLIGCPDGTGESLRAAYVAHDYHDVSDEIKAGWDLSGAALDMRVLARVGWRTANADTWPQWKEGSEFRAVRAAQLARD
ncbi:MAG: M28 family metallopeptidase [Nevskiales bacterium]|nr:M28 family metallopeptidase [Nevskiales bacterium]